MARKELSIGVSETSIIEEKYMARPTWLVDPTKVTNLIDGQVYLKPATGNWNGLALAMKLAEPGDTIGFRGAHTMPSIGVGNFWSPDTVKLPNNQPVHDLHVYGLTDSATLIGGMNIGMQYGLPYNLHFSDYIHKANTQAGYIAFQNSGPYLGLKFTDILVDTSAVHTNGHLINKWVFRFHGPSQFHIENVVQIGQNVEHFVYADNVQGDSIVRNCTATRNGRTMIQICNRGTSGPSGFGHVLIDGCTGISSGYTEAASAFTCSGHAGIMEFRNCKTIDARGGALVAWAAGNNQDYLNAEGKSIDHLIVDGYNFHSTQSDRNSVAISACSLAEMGAGMITHNKAALHLDAQQGKANTLFKFTVPNPSQQGWQVAPTWKCIKGWDKNAYQHLSDQQMDALYVP